MSTRKENEEQVKFHLHWSTHVEHNLTQRRADTGSSAVRYRCQPDPFLNQP